MILSRQKIFPLALLVGLGGTLAATQAGAVSLPAMPQVAQEQPILPAASVEEMEPEMARAYIVGIQEELTDKGYRPGPIDGVMGSQTRAAIRAYQRDAGLPVDGIASNELLDHMKFVEPKVYARTTTAASSTTVLQVQGALATRGYYRGSLDGKTGPQTRAAVEAFQRDAGLTVTGKVDERLLQEIRLAPPNVSSLPPLDDPASLSSDSNVETSYDPVPSAEPAPAVPAAPAVPQPPE